MPRYIAFLRAINVGGHVVKMDDLRRHFAALGFGGVTTFIASGNVVFESSEPDVPALERQIEGHLKQMLGYEVATFLRSAAELAAIAQHQPFPDEEAVAAAHGLYVAFLRAAPPAAAQEKLLVLRTPADDFHFHARELYWLCRTRMSDSPFSGAVLEKTLKMPATLRNVTTVRKMAAKFAALPDTG